jgi:hypothetical protein
VFCADALSSLMLVQPDHFIQTYGIRNPAHPFIDILRNNATSECWQAVVYQKIEHFYATYAAKRNIRISMTSNLDIC